MNTNKKLKKYWTKTNYQGAIVEIKQLLNNITTTCQKNMDSGNWGKNEAMRYAYVTLGKELSKSARFFFSIEGKYGEHGLSVEEMKNIHYADAGYEVTCYVSAKMLKDIFSKLGIECSIIQSEHSRHYVSEGDVLDIYHSYLLCTGDDDKKYFLSLNSDLVNIKLNAAPEHFAVKIPYYYNGVQSYQGEEIEHDTLTPKELLEIDKKIGYAIPLYNPTTGKEEYIYAMVNDPKHDIYGRQKEPYDYLFSQMANLDQGFSNGFESLFENFKDKNGNTLQNYSELSIEQLREVEWYVFESCLELAKSHMNISSDDEKEVFVNIFNTIKLDTKKLKTASNHFVQSIINDSNAEIANHIQTNPFRILSTAIAFIENIERMAEMSRTGTGTEKERAKLRYLYNENKQRVSKLFLTQDIINMYCGDKKPTNEFVVYKILNSMENDFECSTSRTCSYRPIFSTKMQAVEQAKFLKDYLRNLLKLEFPTEKDFQSIIMFSSLSELGNPDKNAFMIYVMSDEEKPTEISYSMVYNPETNTIDRASILAIRQKYKILSKSLNEKLAPPSSTPKQKDEE